MPQIIDLGKIRFSFKGSYSASTTYQQNDVVTFGANAYVYTNTTAASGNAPTDTTRWAVLTSGLQFESAWSSATSYQINDVVTYGGNAYVAILGGSNYVPTNAIYWSPLTSGVRDRGDWVTATQYFPNDLVTRGGSKYSASVVHTSASAFVDDFNTGNWSSFVRGIRNRGAWTTSTSYLKDDIVTDTISTYIANLDFTSNASNFSSEPGGRWTEIAKGQEQLPAQPNKENYLLTTNGSSASWTDSIILDGTITSKQNPILIGASYQYAIDLPSVNPNASAYLVEPGLSYFGLNEIPAGLTNIIGYYSIDSSNANDPNVNSVGDFATFDIQNFSSASTSSTDVVILADHGDDSSGWIDIGITSSTFEDPAFTITGKHDGYIFVEAPIGTSGTGNLVLATGGQGSENKIVFAAGGLSSDNTQMEITPDTNVHIEIDTESTSETTGALTVVGGVGTQGNLNVLGNVNIQGSLQVSGGTFETELLSSTTALFTVGEGAGDNLKDRGFLISYKENSASSQFLIGQVSASAGIGRIYRKTFSTFTRNRTSNVATITVQQSTHDIRVGDVVVITGMTDTDYNGTHTVTVVPTANQFSFANNGANTSGSPADTTGTVSPNIPTQFTVGDSVTISNCDIAAFNGRRDFVRNVETNDIRFDIAASAVQALVSASGTALVNTKTRFGGLARNYENAQWYIFDGAQGNIVTRTGEDSKFTGDQKLQSPQDDINFSASAISLKTITVEGIQGFPGVRPSIPEVNITSASVTGALNVNGALSSTAGGSFAGTYTGTPTFSGNLTFSGNPTFSGTPIFTGGVRVQEMIEDMVDISHTSNAITCNYNDGNIFYVTNTFSGNFTVNLTNAPTTDGRVFTINIFVVQGATGYRPTTLNINSSATTIKWAGGVIPTPTSSSGKIDIFTFTIYRRSGAFDALASANLNF